MGSSRGGGFNGGGGFSGGGGGFSGGGMNWRRRCLVVYITIIVRSLINGGRHIDHDTETDYLLRTHLQI